MTYISNIINQPSEVAYDIKYPINHDISDLTMIIVTGVLKYDIKNRSTAIDLIGLIKIHKYPES